MAVQAYLEDKGPQRADRAVRFAPIVKGIVATNLRLAMARRKKNSRDSG